MQNFAMQDFAMSCTAMFYIKIHYKNDMHKGICRILRK